MVWGTNCTLHNNQVIQGPKRIVDARCDSFSIYFDRRRDRDTYDTRPNVTLSASSRLTAPR
eukprot:scaffold14978_cov135-Isochrysis_galbana.AAC.1